MSNINDHDDFFYFRSDSFKNGDNHASADDDLVFPTKSIRQDTSESSDFFDKHVLERFKQTNPFENNGAAEGFSNVKPGRKANKARVARRPQASRQNPVRRQPQQGNVNSSSARSSVSRPQQIRKKQLNPVLLVLLDILLAGIALVVFALFHHVLPRDLESEAITASRRPISSVSVEQSAQPDETSGTDASDSDTSDSESSEASAQPETIDPNDWKAKFSDKFTDEVVVTDNSYTSPNVSVTTEKHVEGDVTYFVQDIYIANIEAFQTAFGKDKYGMGYNEKIPKLAGRYNAIAAVNGDFYGIGRSGTVIRNGVLYRSDEKEESCVLFYDGTLKVYDKKSYDAEELLEQGAWQSWSFGPNLLDEEGHSISKFDSRLGPKNPRTVLGYYEPGHYCFVVVDGRQDGYSVGFGLTELSDCMERLGCKVAYNLDGGQSSMMTFMDTIADNPYDGGRSVSDILMIVEP